MCVWGGGFQTDTQTHTSPEVQETLNNDHETDKSEVAAVFAILNSGVEKVPSTAEGLDGETGSR